MYAPPRNRKGAEVNRPEAHVAYFSRSPLSLYEHYYKLLLVDDNQMVWEKW